MTWSELAEIFENRQLDGSYLDPLHAKAESGVTKLTRFREEHSQLMALIRRLTQLIGKDAPPPPAELYALRHELSSTLIRHLKAEDWVLYPQLMASPDPTVARLAQAFSSEMGGIAKAFTAYAERWGSYAIERDWPGFRRETADILAALTQRITREERELYPLLHSLNTAAGTGSGAVARPAS